MRTMHPHKNWPALVLAAATLAVVVLLVWAAAGDAILEMRGALNG